VPDPVDLVRLPPLDGLAYQPDEEELWVPHDVVADLWRQKMIATLPKLPDWMLEQEER